MMQRYEKVPEKTNLSGTFFSVLNKDFFHFSAVVIVLFVLMDTISFAGHFVGNFGLSASRCDHFVLHFGADMENDFFHW